MGDDRKAVDRESKAAEELEAELEDREEGVALEDRATREDLTQGMDTGTHDSVRRGVNWPASYRVRTEPASKKESSEPVPPKDSQSKP